MVPTLANGALDALGQDGPLLVTEDHGVQLVPGHRLLSIIHHFQQLLDDGLEVGLVQVQQYLALLQEVSDISGSSDLSGDLELGQQPSHTCHEAYLIGKVLLVHVLALRVLQVGVMKVLVNVLVVKSLFPLGERDGHLSADRHLSGPRRRYCEKVWPLDSVKSR